MNKSILLFILAGACNAAMAGWTVVGGNSDFIQYIDLDKAHVHKTKNSIIVLNLTDYKVAQVIFGYKYYSSILLEEFDCNQNKKRALAGSWFDSHMGAGKVIFSDTSPPNGWESVKVGSIGASQWQAACGSWVRQ
jgi:hypothetical protein